MSCAQTACHTDRHPRHGFSLPGAEVRLRQAAFAYLRHTLARWIARSGQRRDLAELDAHLLKDIGVSPSQAKREVAKPFWVE